MLLNPYIKHKQDILVEMWNLPEQIAAESPLEKNPNGCSGREVLSNECETVQNELFILSFRKKLHLFFFPSSCHCLISLKTLGSITSFLYGESLFVDALCSCAAISAPLKQKKLGYQWKSAENDHFFLMFSPLFFEKLPLHTPSPLILLLPPILCLPPKNPQQKPANYWKQW